MKLLASIVAFLLLPLSSLAQGEDYITEAPPTVYEDEVMSPQNMDFDKTNNMFVAHAGWYNDKLIHYYKFRMYTPGTYPDLIGMTSTNANVPLQHIYFVTSTGDFTGVIGKPIIEYHTSDGNVYSDFMQVVFCEAPTDYVEDTFKSVGDLQAASIVMTEAEIILNIPVVPTGATLQDPVEMGTIAAPISPFPVYYKGVEVWTYVFEVTDASAEAYLTPKTRVTIDTNYAIVVTPFATSTMVNVAPLWHVNQYSNGVMDGKGGGPDPNGMRNIINLDRWDEGYSPLWEIFWVTQVPVNYMANQASHSDIVTEANGFAFIPTPMFVNCPDIGPVGSETNKDKAMTFQTELSTTEENIIQGSGMMLIMQGGLTIEVQCEACDTKNLTSTQTNMMGAFEFSLDGSLLADTTAEEVAVLHDGMELFKLTASSTATATNGDSTKPPVVTAASFVRTVTTTTALALAVTMVGAFLL